MEKEALALAHYASQNVGGLVDIVNRLIAGVSEMSRTVRRLESEKVLLETRLRLIEDAEKDSA